MIEVKKNKNESVINLIKRFTRKVQESSDIARIRRMQFRTRPKSVIEKKKEAIKRSGKKKRLEYLRKLGKIE